MKNLTQEEIVAVLNREAEGTLAFTDGEKPYSVPIGHVYVNESIHFSIFAKGRKWDMFQKNQNVCFTVFGWNDERTDWGSVIIEGKMVPVTDMEQIKAVVRANLIKSNKDLDEQLDKRMEYYINNKGNPESVKLFKIEASEVGGKKSDRS